MKKIIVYIITLIAAISLGVGVISAETAPSTIKMKSTTIKGNKTPVRFPVNFHVKKTMDGKYVFCTYYAKKVPNSGITFTKESLIKDNGMNYILNEAYKNVKDDDTFFIYQTALWMYMIDEGLMQTPYQTLISFEKKLNNNNSNEAKMIKKIVSNAKNASKIDTKEPSIKINTTSNNIKFQKTVDGTEYVSNEIKITSSEKNYEVVLNNQPEGTHYKKSNGSLYIYIPSSSIKSLKTNFTITVKNNKDIYKSYYYTPSNKSYQIMSATYRENIIKKDAVTVNLEIKKSVVVTKLDADTNKQVKGVKLKVTNVETGKTVDSWTTNGASHVVKNLEKGTYLLEEASATTGYNLNTNKVKFTVLSDGTIKDNNGKKTISIILKDNKALEVTKVDAKTNKQVKGIKLRITDSNGKTVDSWTTNGTAHIVRSLSKGTYILEEVSTTVGYNLNTNKIKFTVLADGSMKNNKGESIKALKMTNEKALEVTKIDEDTKEQIKGAKLRITDSNGKTVDSWTTNGTAHTVKSLSKGTYTLEETASPEGYVLSEVKTTFKVLADGKVVNNKNEEITSITYKNKQNNVTISKQDVATSEELPGATLVLKDSKNNIIEKWVSEDKPHYIKGLKKGTYSLEETIAPNEYELSTEKITFTIDEKGKLVNDKGESIDKVVMYNKHVDKNPVVISKQDVATSKELPGAKLVLRDSKNNVIDEWISESTSHIIEDLKAGTYTLEETIAPEDYELSSEKITFTINNKGKLVNDKGESIPKVIMYNKKTPKTDVTISKQDITTSEEIEGAKLVLRDSKNNVIDEWISESTSHKVKNLKKGKYTLEETIAPDGYILSSEKITFIIDEKGNLYNENNKSIDKVIMYNAPVTSDVNIIKLDKETQEKVEGAVLQIEDLEGNVIDTWTTTKEAHKVEKLGIGTYFLKETKSPNGYVLNENTITFQINEEGKLLDENDKEISFITMYNEKVKQPTRVSISKRDITNDEELPGATLVVKDINGNVIDTWVSGNTPHIIEGLELGTYTLTEITSPDGYILNEETITFTVSEEGVTTKVVMYNSPVVIPEEIIVENTGSFRNPLTALFGLFTVGYGINSIKKNSKKEEK